MKLELSKNQDNSIQVSAWNKEKWILTLDKNLTPEEQKITEEFLAQKEQFKKQTKNLLGNFIESDYSKFYSNWELIKYNSSIQDLQSKLWLNESDLFTKELFFKVVEFQINNNLKQNWIPDLDFFAKLSTKEDSKVITQLEELADEQYQENIKIWIIKEEKIQLVKEYIILNNWKITLKNIDKNKTIPKEIKEFIDKLNNKLLKISLITSVAEIFNKYLDDIYHNIHFKFKNTKDDVIKIHIKAIKEELDNLNNFDNIEKISKLDLNTTIDKIFPLQTRLLDSISDNNHKNEVKTNIIQIKELLINNINSNSLSPNKAINIRNTIFDKIRTQDRIDDNTSRYNSSPYIREKLEWEILNNEKLRENANISKVFDVIKEFESDKWLTQLKSIINIKWQKNLWDYQYKLTEYFKSKWLEKYGFSEKQPKHIASITVTTLSNFLNWWLTSLLWNREKDIKKSLKERIKEELEDNKKDAKKRNDKETLQKIEKMSSNIDKQVEEQYRELQDEVLSQILKKHLISGILEKNVDFFKFIEKNDSTLQLYDKINAITWWISDEKMDKIIKYTQEFTMQVIVAYLSVWIGSYVAKALSLWTRASAVTTRWLNALKLSENMVSKWASVSGFLANSAIEWWSFYTVGKMYNNAMTEDWLDNIFKWYSSKELLKSITFIATYKKLEEWNVLWITDPKISVGKDILEKLKNWWLKISNSALSVWVESLNVIFSAIGTDLVFGEWFKQITYEELFHATALVIWFRMAWIITSPKVEISKKWKSIEIKWIQEVVEKINTE